ncbi:MAG: Ig-like domain-containing protein, partial [Clostridiales bacterium]|nr:Ig-like domain-containing protein [Clostridiales bacterium]
MSFQGRKKRKIALLMLFAVLFMNLFPISSGENNVIISPMVTTAYAADVTIAPGMFGMEVDSQYRPNGSLIEMEDDTIPIAIAHSSNSIPSGATVEWLEYNHEVIEVISATDYKVVVKAVGPGYSQFAAIVRYQGMAYQVYCQIHVPLKMDTSAAANTVDSGFGMIGNLHYGDGSQNVSLQLSTVPVSGSAFERTHYLVKLEKVKYKEGVTNNTIASPSAIAVTSPAIIWSTSDEKVATVDPSGIITSVGAGYAEIVAETTTSFNGKKDTIKIPVFVSPIGQVSTSNEAMKSEISFTASSNTFTINTNAVEANKLVWTIHEGDSSSGRVINPEKENLMDLSLSKYSGSATFTNVKAGKYYITARPTDKFSEGNSAIHELRIHVDVPVFFSHDKITMTVGDYYDILKNSNVPSKTWYNFVALNNTIVELSQGIITAKQSGTTTITMTALQPGLDNGATNQTMEVTVVDGINLNTTAATIYVGSSIQLVLNASNSAAPITWTSSDPSIAMVDEDGKVTGQKAGDCVITVKQVINGVTKSLKCNIKVIASVTSIVLDPTTKDIAIGDNLTINATATPKINNLKLIWVTSDESVVKISSAGDMSATVTGVSGGTAVISAINKDNIVVGSCLVKVYQPIEKITLSETDVKVPLSDKSFQLYATVLPASAKEQEIIWKSTDTSVAVVDADGTVTVKKPGTATIIATSKVNANISAMCKVTVMKSVSGITLDYTSRAMYVGETFRLTYTIKPADSSNTAVIWTSSNPSIATVNNEGLITAKSVGTAVIILKTVDGGHMATCTLTISRTATAVKLDVTKLTMNVGDYYYLGTKLTPADSTETTLTWESSEPKVATVSKTGKVIAKSAGKTIIMVKTKSGSTGYCTVTVCQPVTGIEMSSEEETISIGEKLELEANVLPATASDQGVSWESSNTDVATVNQKGEVKGVAGGVTMISATSDDGNYKAYCMVTVEELVTSIKLNHSWYRLGLGRSITLKATIN